MYCVHTFPFPCYHEVSQYCCLNSGKLTCTSIKYFGFVFRKVDTFRICFVSRIFFHSLFLVYSQGVLAFYCCENCENPRLVKQLLFITSDKAFYINITWAEILSKYFKLIIFQEKNLYFISAGVSYNFIFFICCAQISESHYLGLFCKLFK